MEKWQDSSVCFEQIRQGHAWFEEETISLNGMWRILLQKEDEAVPGGVTEEDFSVQDWAECPIPSAFPGTESENDGSTGLVGRLLPTRTELKRAFLRRSFRLPSAWQGRPVILRLEDVRGGIRVWVNGSEAGISKGRLSATELEISSLLKPDKNRICIELHRETVYTALSEDQTWESWGLCGHAELYSLPVQRIEDLWAVAEFSPEHQAQALVVHLETKNAEGLFARVALMEENQVRFYGEGKLSAQGGSLRIPCPEARLWSEDQPFLYRIAVILTDGIGIYHTRQIPFGFREISLDPNGLTLNGRPCPLYGVNYRRFSADEDTLQRDLDTMKAHHINALWLRSPMPQRFYELCDEKGLYVVDSSRMQTVPGPLSLGAAQQEAHLIRSHRSHPSVLLWDLQLGQRDIRPLDGTRPVTGAFFRMQNPTLEELRQAVGESDLPERATGLRSFLSGSRRSEPAVPPQQPILVERYGEVLGNGSVPVGKYGKLLRNHPQLCGLFLWNYADESLGGQWKAGCRTGLVTEQGVAHHLMTTVSSGYQRLVLVRHENSITVHNFDPFHPLSDFCFTCRLTRDGDEEESYQVSLEGRYGEAATFPLSFRCPMFRSGHYGLELRAELEEQVAAFAGWELKTIPLIRDDRFGGSIREENGRILLRAQRMTYEISRATGNLEQISIDGTPLLTAPLAPEFCRPQTAFDRRQKQLEEWEKLTLRKKLPKPSVFEVDHMTRSVTVHQAVGAGLQRSYRLYASGSLEVELRLRTGKTAPSRVGMGCSLHPEFCDFFWMGLGPGDTYPDRMEGACYGPHSIWAVNDQDLYPIVQEYGSKMRVHALSLCREDGLGLRITSAEGLTAGIRRWDLEQLCSVERSTELPRSENVSLFLDAAQDGLEQAFLQPRTTYTYRFLLEPAD